MISDLGRSNGDDKPMDLSKYRESAHEQARIADLFRLIPPGTRTVLDIGARDGYLSTRLADAGLAVTALDLQVPAVDHPGVRCVKGDASALEFAAGAFDLVLCAEVLEHLPREILVRACSEIGRVSRHTAIIGVPYRQDIRVGRTTCASCGQRNPPYGHVNSFDEDTLRHLFRDSLRWDTASFVGENTVATNPVSTALLDFAGNPFGTYDQEEACVWCGGSLGRPRERDLLRKAATRAAFILNALQAKITRPHANWIHVRFMKVPA